MISTCVEYMHPLSLYEVNPNPAASDLDQLLAFGGFRSPSWQAS
jgi:hypothetical protein